MTAIATSPAELLFSNAEGKPISLEDLIDDGLDGACRNRAATMLGWRPRVGVREGIRRVQPAP